MDASRRIRPKAKNAESESFGLLAIGSSGGWDVAVDETTTGPAKWFAQVEGPSLYLYFEIASPSVIARTLHFLEQQIIPQNERPTAGTDGASQILRLGSFSRTPIALTWDNEYPDRCFFVISPAGEPSVRLSLSAGEIKMLIEALRQVREDLEGEGLL